jgi:hypothetical protein
LNITAKSVLAKLSAITMVAGMLAISTAVSSSGDTLTRPVSNWYEALQLGDIEILSIIMAEEATIDLRDLGIIQTRTEFIDAFGQWQEFNKDARILTRQASASEDEVVAEVCYRFPSNESYHREVFSLSQGLITGSVQEKIGETCTGF